MFDLCLRAVQSLTHSPSPSNLNVHSKGLSLPAARPCPLSVSGSICLFLTNRTDCQSVCLLSAGLSGFRICLYVCLPDCLEVRSACLPESLPSLTLYGCMISYEPLTMPWKSNHPAQLDVCLCLYTQMCIQERKQPATHKTKGVPPSYDSSRFWGFFVKQGLAVMCSC